MPPPPEVEGWGFPRDCPSSRPWGLPLLQVHPARRGRSDTTSPAPTTISGTHCNDNVNGVHPKSSWDIDRKTLSVERTLKGSGRRSLNANEYADRRSLNATECVRDEYADSKTSAAALKFEADVTQSPFTAEN